MDSRPQQLSPVLSPYHHGSPRSQPSPNLRKGSPPTATSPHSWGGPMNQEIPLNLTKPRGFKTEKMEFFGSPEKQEGRNTKTPPPAHAHSKRQVASPVTTPTSDIGPFGSGIRMPLGFPQYPFMMANPMVTSMLSGMTHHGMMNGKSHPDLDKVNSLAIHHWKYRKKMKCLKTVMQKFLIKWMTNFPGFFFFRIIYNIIF